MSRIWSVSRSVKKYKRVWTEYCGPSADLKTVDEVSVYVGNEVLGGDELVTRGNNGGLEVALEGLDGLYLGGG